MAGTSQGEMPFLDHLEELRWRLFRCAIAIALGVGVSFALLVTKNIDVIALLERPIKPYLNRSLIVTHPADLFNVVIDVSLTLGLVAASPVIIWQIWGFLSPALYGHEKKVIIPSLVGAAFLFLCGMALAYVYVLPVTFKFFLSFESASVEAFPALDRYMDFVIAMCLAFGAAFELPIVIMLLTALGIVQPKFLAKFRRHALVGCVIAAAVITPGSELTALGALSTALYLLYEVSITLSRVIYTRRERSIAAAETT